MDNVLLWAGAAILVLIISSNKAGASPSGDLNLQSLADQYGQDAINRLNQIYSALLNNGLTPKQILFCLSQILLESGLFTDVANYPLLNRNNYAGLTVERGGYAMYNSINDFVNAYIGFLSKWSDPLDATDITDFNNRLVSNHYYTSDPGSYLANLKMYYNILTNTQF